jgi:PAS domain-containing protein
VADVLDLFAHVGDAAFAVDKRQSIVFWNAAAETLLGFSAAEATGRFCWHLLDGHTPAGRLFCGPGCPILQILRHNITPQPFTLVVRSADHRRLHVNVSTVPVPTSEDPDDMLLLVHLFREDHPFAPGADPQ